MGIENNNVIANSLKMESINYRRLIQKQINSWKKRNINKKVADRITCDHILEFNLIVKEFKLQFQKENYDINSYKTEFKNFHKKYLLLRWATKKEQKYKKPIELENESFDNYYNRLKNMNNEFSIVLSKKKIKIDTNIKIPNKMKQKKCAEILQNKYMHKSIKYTKILGMIIKWCKNNIITTPITKELFVHICNLYENELIKNSYIII